VQRLRIRYAKRGRARFTSHRDFGRAFERALRRAGVPMAYSSGFSPHPRISYANAAPTGAASEAEYLEIALAERCRSDRVRTALNAALPDGLDVLTVVEASGPPLVDRLTGSCWRASVPSADGMALDLAIEALQNSRVVTVQRMTKGGLRCFDVRHAVVMLKREGSALEMVLRQGAPLVRPDDVVSALQALDPGLVLGAAVFTRLSQGLLDPDTGAITDPLC
jgi:radical SAM-linked protein